MSVVLFFVSTLIKVMRDFLLRLPKHSNLTVLPSTRSPLHIPHDGVSNSGSVNQSTYDLTTHCGEGKKEERKMYNANFFGQGRSGVAIGLYFSTYHLMFSADALFTYGFLVDKTKKLCAFLAFAHTHSWLLFLVILLVKCEHCEVGASNSHVCFRQERFYVPYWLCCQN
jgi:hypothetical protein